MTVPLLTVLGLCKRYPGVQALNDVGLEVSAGEVHALLGENGAGKSTLLRLLSGAALPDAGEIRLDGAALDAADGPAARQALGVVTIYQEFNLVPAMTVAENLYLGREPRLRGLIDWRRMNAEAAVVLDRLGAPLAPTARIDSLSVAAQQMVEIARALTLKARLIVMDEPTAALSAQEVAHLHRIIGELKEAGIAIVYVTHRLDEVKAICDRYTVLRDGRFVAGGMVADATTDDFVRAMVGRDVEPPRRSSVRGPVALSVGAVSGRTGQSARIRDVSLEVHEGEIVGLAGLVGAGRTELARMVFGADPSTSGVLWMGGDRPGLFRSPAEAMGAGLALVPEDRKAQGCFMDHSVRWNLSLPNLSGLTHMGLFVDERAERTLVETFVKRLRIRTPTQDTAIGALSGGNQQKVLLARCMALRPRVLIVDEPTRGVDIGAKAEVHQILFDLAADGVGIIVISSDLPELLELSDRILVLREGREVGRMDRATANEHGLMSLMTGQPSESSQLAEAS